MKYLIVAFALLMMFGCSKDPVIPPDGYQKLKEAEKIALPMWGQGNSVIDNDSLYQATYKDYYYYDSTVTLPVIDFKQEIIIGMFFSKGAFNGHSENVYVNESEKTILLKAEEYSNSRYSYDVAYISWLWYKIPAEFQETHEIKFEVINVR